MRSTCFALVAAPRRAGPVGGAKSTVTAELVSFMRSKGTCGGLNLDGSVVHANGDWNNAYYGAKGVLPPDILIRKKYRKCEGRAAIAGRRQSHGEGAAAMR